MMRSNLLKSLFASAVIAGGLMTASGLNAANPVVKDGARVAVVGDSITEQKIYSRYIEAYLLACSGLKDVKVIQYGWGGERAPGYVARMENDTMIWNPTLVTTCYGMNDGSYRAYDEKAVGVPYRDNMQKIVSYFKSKGVAMIVGTPGVVDSEMYKRNPSAAVYNENLAKLGQIAKELAAKENTGFADVNGVMMDAMTKAKAALGKDYHVAGPDGVHPAPNGQLLMAYAFLKAMGFDGKIAEINMDFTGKTTASEGQKILNQKPGSVEIETTRYPFCFNVNPNNSKDPGANATILPFVPFQQDLNRFELKVTNLPGDKATVAWGTQKKVFSKADLEKGINLAAEFIDNPFSTKFNQLLNELFAKQNYETWMIKNMITNFRGIKGNLPAIEKDAKIKESVDYLREKMMQRQAEFDAKVHAVITPVKYQITVVPVQ